MTSGDLLRLNSGADTLLTRITVINEFPSFTALLDSEYPAAIAGTDESRDELMSAIREIYPLQKEALGTFAIHVHVLT